MIKKRRAAFDRAHALLGDVIALRPISWDRTSAAARQLRSVNSLQMLLIKEIMRAERKIWRTKAVLKSLDATTNPELADELRERIEAYRHLSYIWRCFGDGIAFVFMDKFALKQTYFNTHNVNAKQDAGFLGGKEGFQNERRAIDELLQRGVPALLTDLTNTIRHGDVCVMLGPDPVLVEVKSNKLDRRGKRQKKSIRTLTEFFETDEALGLRGFEKIRRISHQSEEVIYSDHMNDCISAAIRSGAACLSPEEGLYYAAVADERINLRDILGELKLVHPAVFSLNEMKANRAWAPYMPFTLSIRDRDALFRFVWGSIYLVVVYDLDALCRIAQSEGLTIKLMPPDSEIAFEVGKAEGSGQVGVARQFFNRLAFDFASPAWLLHTTVEVIDRHNVEIENPSTAAGSVG